MLAVPLMLSQAFEAQLNQRNVPDQQRRDFHKWFRFYLDFCDKYDSKPQLTTSFAAFDEKLKSKGQSGYRRRSRLARTENPTYGGKAPPMFR